VDKHRSKILLKVLIGIKAASLRLAAASYQRDLQHEAKVLQIIA